MRHKFEEQLHLLNINMIEMGALIEKNINTATTALITQDTTLARSAIELDDEIDSKESEIESLCLKLLLQQQPVASDLRQISAALKMITDMERIGDGAADIAEITVILSTQTYIKKMEHIPQMAAATIKMVTEAVDAYVKKDLALAQAVIEYDDIVDELFVRIKSNLIALIHADKENGSQALDLLMIAKYFERIGDHATNIAEWVVFSLTGTHKDTKIM